VKRDQEKQSTCKHLKTTQSIKSWEKEEKREYMVAHLHCQICGMFFGRELWDTAKQISHEENL
jgi:hypothetical protein